MTKHGKAVVKQSEELVEIQSNGKVVARPVKRLNCSNCGHEFESLVVGSTAFGSVTTEFIPAECPRCGGTIIGIEGRPEVENRFLPEEYVEFLRIIETPRR